MIQIKHDNLANIATEYFGNVKDLIKVRSLFYYQLFKALSNNDALNSKNLSDDLNNNALHGSTKKYLTNQLLIQNKLSDQKQYGAVVIGNCFPWVIPILPLIRNISVFFQDEVNIERIILCAPEEAITCENSIKLALGITNSNFTNHVKNIINNIINYPLFNQFAYSIGSRLGVNTCPYCNRNYIHTVIDKQGKNIIRPTFDHFFSQVDHPLLSLNFYNLIPSCYYCNSSLKGEAKMHLDTNMHPYIEGFDNDVSFWINLINLKPRKSDPENYSLTLVDAFNGISTDTRYRKIFGGSRAVPNSQEGNINLFKIKEIYQSHLDIVGEIVVKCDTISSGYANSLLQLFGQLNTNKAEFYQFYFGNYYNPVDFHRRPLAKLYKDVVSQFLPYYIK